VRLRGLARLRARCRSRRHLHDGAPSAASSAA
jgi:hypothetical protein